MTHSFLHLQPDKHLLQKVGTVGLVGLLMASAGGAGWIAARQERESIAHAATETANFRVKTALAERNPVEADRVLTGSVEAVNTVTLTSRVAGTIRELSVEEGDRVRAGDPIAFIDVADIQAQRTQAEASIPQAQASVSAAQSAYLAAQSQQNQARAFGVEAQAFRAEAQTRLDQAIAAHETAKAQLQEAQANLEDAKLNQRRMTMLQADGAVSQSRLDDANTRLAMAAAQVEQIRSEIDRRSGAIEQARTQIQQANAQVEQASAQVEQSQAQIEQASAQVEQAEAGVQQARAQVDRTIADLDYGTVTAPFDGVITRKHTDVGAMAGAGQSIVTLESTDRLRFSVPVPESLVGQLKLNQPMTVRIDALDRAVRGRVSQIVPSSDPRAHNFTVKIDLDPDNGVMPGMFGRLALTSQNREALMVPTEAIVERLGIQGVYVVQGNQAYFRSVVTGATHGDVVEIFRGVEEGDRIVLSPVKELRDGSPVAPIN
ncbi:efflux RND transporter periplasmic adaptor subunit [Baaleninema simplex]|uniref:efflux RND transporter periplasmic adaptor subunit n=1 Tax=Baaleninema simplex TaxID=2862350 RepID=UPI0003693894|nr:efflux RND transporter periplasmic adaptor subunit [Baaleninema simplex]